MLDALQVSDLYFYEFVGSPFNDIFAFFVDGINIATLNGTSTPLSINNLNCGNPFGSADNFCSLFNNNEIGASAFNLQYDGFTDVLGASFRGCRQARTRCNWRAAQA